jgi:predicted DNA-binding transcriptional regulator AlpA
MTIYNTIKLLNNANTAQILGVRPNTLDGWRVKGIGPVYRKIGRSVRYVESDVLAWLDAQTHTSTSQYSTHMKHGYSATYGVSA